MKDVLVFEFSDDKHTYWIGAENKEDAEVFYLEFCCGTIYDQKYTMKLIRSPKYLNEPFIKDEDGNKISLLDCISRESVFPCLLASTEVR